jgi:membrane protease YdiL (CAAX protease family)
MLMRRQLGRKLALRRFSPWQCLLVLLLLVPQAVVASELANLVHEVVRWIDSPFLDQLNDMSWVESFAKQPWPLILLGACVFPALGEELLFRGVLSRGLIAWHGVMAGSIFASVLFGLMHLVPAQAVATIVIGLVLQLVFLCTRSLWAPILLHLLNNAMAFSAVRFGSVIPLPGFTVDAEHIPPLVVLAALLASVALLGLLLQTRTRWQLPDGSEWSPGFFPTESPPVGLNAQPVSRAPSLLLSAVTVVLLATFVVAVRFSLSAA